MARRSRRGFVTTVLAAVTAPAVLLLALLSTPSGPPGGTVEARQALGHEAQTPAPSPSTFTPEALPEANPALTPPTAPAAGPGAATGVLRLVYFVEADAVADPRAAELIEAQAGALQLFWFEQFGGTFALPTQGVELVYGDHPAGWYDETVSGDDPRWHRLLNIQDEVRAKLGIGDRDDARMIVYPATR
ncbi:MAG: hypothetical protein AAGK32_17230, partial [Actinomycetota bacterium]